jgi:hypothetical protein
MHELQIGVAWSPTAPIVLQLHATGEDGIVGDARLTYPRSHPHYEKVLRHLGGLRPGEMKPVKPWSEWGKSA